MDLQELGVEGSISESQPQEPASAEVSALHMPFSVITYDREVHESASVEPPPPPNLSQELADWAAMRFVTHTAVDSLLEILRKHGHDDLPKTSKTLLATPRSTKSLIKKLCGGEFWYGGILNGIKTRLSFGDFKKLHGFHVAIDIFVDGISPYKSVKKHLCAIAGFVVGQSKPFEIALWCGNIHEPSDVHLFFEDFVTEAKDLLSEGFIIDGISATFSFSIDKYIGDALARAWIFQFVIPPHSFFCCERCTVQGKRVCHRTIFDPCDEATLRTDDSLASQTHKNHHAGTSPLLPLGVKLLSQCPIESMHNVDLGVGRRICQFLFSTKKRVSKITVKKCALEDLSTHLMSLKPYYASEFNRKLRPLTDWTIYKASEFRRLCLYDSFFLFKELEVTQIYKVHNLFSCGIRILADEDLVGQFRGDANRLLINFVRESSKLFGPLFNVFNIHCLVHLADETARHGRLINFSAWKYETYLGQIKRCLRAPGRTLQQIMCRLVEKRLVLSRRLEASTQEDAIGLSQPHVRGPTLGMCGEQFACMSIRDLGLFRISSPNDVCFVSTSREICVLRNIIKKSGTIKLVCRAFLETDELFDYPFSSKLLGICTAKKLGPLKMLSINEMKEKVVLLPLKKCDVRDEPNFRWMNDVECVLSAHATSHIRFVGDD